MQLDDLITHLQSQCPSVAQVLKAESVDREAVDTSDIVKNLVKDAVQGRAYPSKLPGNKTFPALVYQLVSSHKVAYSQFNLLQSDVFVIYFQAKTYLEIVGLRTAIRTALVNYDPANTAGDIEITDEMIEFLYDQNLHQCAMEINIVHLNGSNQSLPALIVYESSNATPDNEMTGTVAQFKEVELSLNIIAKHADQAAIRNEVESAMLGYREQNYGPGAEYVSGGRLESLVNTTVWDDRYRLRLRPMIANR